MSVFKRNGSGNSLSDFERQLLAGCCLSLMQPFGSATGRLEAKADIRQRSSFAQSDHL